MRFAYSVNWNLTGCWVIFYLWSAHCKWLKLQLNMIDSGIGNKHHSLFQRDWILYASTILYFFHNYMPFKKQNLLKLRRPLQHMPWRKIFYEFSATRLPRFAVIHIRFHIGGTTEKVLRWTDYHLYIWHSLLLLAVFLCFIDLCLENVSVYTDKTS